MTIVRRLLAAAAALLVAIASGARTVGADCPPERDEIRVLVVADASGTYDQSLADTLADVLAVSLSGEVQGVTFTTRSDAVALARHIEQNLLVGNEVDIDALGSALGAPFVLALEFSKRASTGQQVTGSLVSMRTGNVVRRVRAALPDDETLQPPRIEALASSMAPNLRCDLAAVRVRPAVPVVLLSVSPEEVGPGEPVHVQITLRDSSDGQVQTGMNVFLEHTPPAGGAPAPQETRVTDALGRWTGDVAAGSEPGQGTIVATFVGSDRTTARSVPARYRVRDTAGDLTIGAPEAALVLGGATTVTARLTHDGAPVAGAAVSFAASGGGGVTAGAVVTDANGYAAAQYDAPDANSIVDVTATAPTPDLTASLTFVVDGGVALNVNALDTLPGGTSDVTADLLFGGTPLPATEVTFTLAGDGTLSAASAPTNDAGRAAVTWLAPSGTSAAVITAAAVVDGERYAQTVTVRAAPPHGTMSAKVVPIMDRWATSAYLYAGGAGICSFEDLTGVSTGHCGISPTGAGAPTDPPVALRAEVNGCWAKMDVTRSDQRTLVVDCSGLATDRPDGCVFLLTACLELTFDEPGVLRVESDPSISGQEYTWVMGLRPRSGTTIEGHQLDLRSVVNVFGDQVTYYDFEAPPAASGTVDIAQPETLQFVVHFEGLPGPGTTATGGMRFTLSFRGR